jgi:ATP-dependent RNA helicase RhlE
MAKIAQQFEDFKLNRQLLLAVDELNYVKPTLIQQKVIPLINAGHDVLGIAQTGTGKTAAYLLPLLYKIKYAEGSAARALVLAPTKELVLQIHENASILGKYLDLRMMVLYGGVGADKQIEALSSGVDIIISTPGRFLDIYSRGELQVKKINTLVLDEADKMMDYGFMPQIREILEKIPRRRQNLLFSATFPDKVKTLSDEFLEFPEKVEITPQATPASTVRQIFYPTPNLKTKINLLDHLLNDSNLSRVIVFVKTKKTASNIYKYLERTRADEVRVIHANKSQNSRINAFRAFQSGQIRVLVSTDVSARGLDISDVSHVINFDVPMVYEDYVHRIGRTGRAEKSGEAITFANKAEQLHIGEIEKLIKMKIPESVIPDGLTVSNTSKEESINIEQEIDRFKRKQDPNFKGAFHEKKQRKKRPSFSAKGKLKGRKR